MEQRHWRACRVLVWEEEERSPFWDLWLHHYVPNLNVAGSCWLKKANASWFAKSVNILYINIKFHRSTERKRKKKPSAAKVCCFRVRQTKRDKKSVWWIKWNETMHLWLSIVLFLPLVVKCVFIMKHDDKCLERTWMCSSFSVRAQCDF